MHETIPTTARVPGLQVKLETSGPVQSHQVIPHLLSGAGSAQGPLQSALQGSSVVREVTGRIHLALGREREKLVINTILIVINSIYIL